MNTPESPNRDLPRPDAHSFLTRLRPPVSGSQPALLLLTVVSSWLLISIVYVWLISSGSWTRWKTFTSYYDQLASAFMQGQLALELGPDPALLALENPYDPEQLKDVPYPVDVSLYRGRFYLYFGPVPALILIPIKALGAEGIGDQYLVFVFTVGSLVMQSLILLKIGRQFFCGLGNRSVAFGVLVIGLTGPVGWVLGKASVYNAAVIGGQFLYLAGLYAAMDVIANGSGSKVPLVVSGLLWAAAVASRITQIVPVILVGLLISARIVRSCKRDGGPLKYLLRLLPLGLPLALGIAALGWYNWARFGSPLETGVGYQLTRIPLREYQGRLYTPLFVPQNLHNYLLTPPTVRPSFPYFRPTKGSAESVIPAFPLPAHYRPQEIVGLLFMVPFVVFAVATVSRQNLDRGRPAIREESALRWILGALWGSFLSSFILFLFFFWEDVRYFGDFLPPLVLLSIIGFWRLEVSSARWWRRATILLLAGTLFVISVVVSQLLAISVNADDFRQLNPVFWRQLSNLFRR